jgi:GntR family transcriptional regulator/MocR family aminotransferase
MGGLLLGRLELSRESGEALTRQLANQLRGLITGGRLRPGQTLPSSRTLARSLDVSRNTVSFAIEQLTAEGYLSTSQGRRPVVVAGASLVSNRAPSRRAENRAIPGLISGWARDLHHIDWPPI